MNTKIMLINKKILFLLEKSVTMVALFLGDFYTVNIFIIMSIIIINYFVIPIDDVVKNLPTIFLVILI